MKRLCSRFRNEKDFEMVIDVDQSVIRNPNWWQRRTKLERRLMRFAVVLAFLNIALIVALGIILTGRRNLHAQMKKNQTNLLYLTSSSCNCTTSSPEIN